MTEQTVWKPYKLDGIATGFEQYCFEASIPMYGGSEVQWICKYRCIGCGWEINGTYTGEKEVEAMRFHFEHCND